MPFSTIVDDDPALASAAEYRRRSAHARAEAHSRYRIHLREALGQRGVEDAETLADVVLGALFEWRYIDTGEHCRCSCHPRLPDSDLHDYGFDCVCTRTDDQRRAAFQRWLNDIDAYWESPAGQRIRAAQQAAEAELQKWLAQQPGVTVRSHGGWAPEQWTGEIDGHSFYFRERHDDWHIEIDLRPTGRFTEVLDTTNDDGATRRQQELKQGDVIATGTIYAEDYGTTVVARAQFIVNTVRDHLTRQAFDHCADRLDSVRAILETDIHWCPACGARLSTA